MRSRLSIVVLLLAVACAAGPAVSKPLFDIKAKGRFIQPPPPAAETGLRGPLDPASSDATALDELPSGAPRTTGALTASSGANLSSSRLNPASRLASTTSRTAGRPPVVAANAASPPFPAISLLKPVGDQAPICRAECAETRYTCATTENTECDSKWSQCVAGCSTPASP